jgi:acyl-CoA synthetase (AMP-forming)/AMP-acid ligase II
MWHVNAQVVGLLAALVAGSSLILDDRFHRTGFWDLMGTRRVTWINAVPAIISRLSVLDGHEVVPSGVRFIRSASAPLPAETMTRFEAHTGIPVLETYGMTEAASQITANPLRGPRKAGSVGRPVGVELRVVAGPPTGLPGLVEIRGPSVIASYGDGRARDRIDPDGWLQTGDIGHLDEDGYLYLDGRIDDVINRGGEKMFPREIEEVILRDPDVAAVAVVGRDDPELGQVPVAFLVLRPVDGATCRNDVTERIRRSLEMGLARSKRPVSLLVVPHLPIGATGKVLRRALRGHAAPELLRTGPA